MKAIITNAIQEGDRIRIFVSFSDGTERTFFKRIESTKPEIVDEIKILLRTKEQTENSVKTLIDKIVNLEIE